MGGIRFEWDPRKSLANRRKHGITFDEAQTVFFDEEALLTSDEEHSDFEDRFVLLGMSSGLRVLLVCHFFREDDSVIRLISARKANRNERKQYFERRSP